ncbi:hypothetical protein MIR68_000334 [Amoeboaphelidium protococcarum]|nr:hypothetical protein MIR68_000334 [Amoeboaphelidium protococcarum]
MASNKHDSSSASGHGFPAQISPSTAINTPHNNNNDPAASNVNSNQDAVISSVLSPQQSAVPPSLSHHQPPSRQSSTNTNTTQGGNNLNRNIEHLVIAGLPVMKYLGSNGLFKYKLAPNANIKAVPQSQQQQLMMEVQALQQRDLLMLQQQQQQLLNQAKLMAAPYSPINFNAIGQQMNLDQMTVVGPSIVQNQNALQKQTQKMQNISQPRSESSMQQQQQQKQQYQQQQQQWQQHQQQQHQQQQQYMNLQHAQHVNPLHFQQQSQRSAIDQIRQQLMVRSSQVSTLVAKRLKQDQDKLAQSNLTKFQSFSDALQRLMPYHLCQYQEQDFSYDNEQFQSGISSNTSHFQKRSIQLNDRYHQVLKRCADRIDFEDSRLLCDKLQLQSELDFMNRFKQELSSSTYSQLGDQYSQKFPVQSPSDHADDTMMMESAYDRGFVSSNQLMSDADGDYSQHYNYADEQSDTSVSDDTSEDVSYDEDESEDEIQFHQQIFTQQAQHQIFLFIGSFQNLFCPVYLQLSIFLFLIEVKLKKLLSSTQSTDNYQIKDNMGAVLACLGTDLACCFGSMACKCFYQILGTTLSTSTRISYAIIFMLNSIVAWVMLSDWAIKALKERFDKIPFYKIDCPEGVCYGTLATYRITMALTLFHLIMALFTYGIRSTNDLRAGIQNGYWGIKLLIIVALTVTCFYLPNSMILAYGGVATFTSGIFILIQLVLLIDMAYRWSEICLEKYEESDDRSWMVILAGGSILMLIGSIVITGFLFAYYGMPHCKLNQFFISFNLILGVISAVVSIYPSIQEENPQSGLPQSAFLMLYSTYLVYTALSSEPDAKCNFSQAQNHKRNDQVIIGVILTFLALVYSTSSAASNSGAFIRSNGEDGIALISDNERGAGGDSSRDGDDALNDPNFNDESDGCTYNYSFFHIIFAIGSMYVAMLLTNWDIVKTADSADEAIQLGRSWQATWVKVVTSWMAYLMYIWTLVAPLVLPDREWN